MPIIKNIGRMHNCYKMERNNDFFPKIILDSDDIVFFIRARSF